MAIEYFLSVDELDLALCSQADPEIFFSVGEQYPYYEEAVSICNKCEVRERCANFARDNHLIGIWGGTTGKERGRHLERH